MTERGYAALPPAKDRRELWALPDQFPVIAIRKLSWQSTLLLTVLGTSSKRDLLARFSNDCELQAELSQRLAVLASDGVIDPDELRRQVLASFPLA